MSKRFLKLRGLTAAGFIAAGVAAGPVAGQLLPPEPVRFDIQPLRTSLVTGTSMAAWILGEAFKSDLPYATCAPCNPAGLWGIDRGTLGPLRRGNAVASDMTLDFTLGATAALVWLDRGPRQEGVEQMAVLVQALSVSSAATVWTKILFHRPRPVLYQADAAQHLSPDNGLSFPSGHTMLAFAAAGAYMGIQQRRGQLGRRKTLSAILLASAAATGVLRVTARRHFPTDVLAGAVLGSGIGFLVPMIHPVRRP